MSMKAIKDVYTVQPSVAPGVYKANLTGNAIDMANQEENLIAINVGPVTDGTYVSSLQDSADGVTYNAVPAANIVGAPGPLAANTVQKLSYIGPNRYVQPVVTVGGAPATGAAISVVAVTKPRKQPAP